MMLGAMSGVASHLQKVAATSYRLCIQSRLTSSSICRSIVLTSAFAVSLLGSATGGTVKVDNTVMGNWSANQQVAPASYVALPLGEWRSGDLLSVRVKTDNPLANDLTACIATEEEARRYVPQRSPCKGRLRTTTPFEIRGAVDSNGQKFLILDNSYANFVTKKIAVNVAYRKTITAQQAEALREPLEGIRSRLNDMFTYADFNISVKSCGQSNAFSDHTTADITMCSELLQEFAVKQNLGAILATLLHEYGHSLLTKWGEPGSSEEDMADQFATAMLLKGGDKGRALLMQWVSSWLERDSAAEARNQLSHDDTHSLSIQRARNIQRNIVQSDELLRRWNKMLYRHMTRHALEDAALNPGKGDDVDLAKDALKAYDSSSNPNVIAANAQQRSSTLASATALGSSCTMSLQCDRGQACRRHHCDEIPDYQKRIKQIPSLESVEKGGACLGDEHCTPGLICSPVFAKCEAE